MALLFAYSSSQESRSFRCWHAFQPFGRKAGLMAIPAWQNRR